MSLLDDIRTAQLNAGEAVVIASLTKSGLVSSDPQPQACKGPNCGSRDGRFHSRECWAEYDATTGAMGAWKETGSGQDGSDA